MLSLNYRDARPIYEQIRDGLRRLVVTGAIAPGETFPPAQILASRFAINPSTVRRAYEALEEEGYLTPVPGGHAAAGGEGGTALRREELLTTLDNIVRELAFLGMTRSELADRVAETAGHARPFWGETPEDNEGEEERL